MGTALFLSPLRYPGGKGKLTKFLARVIESQPTAPEVYVEPYAGGAGAALQLLYGEYVQRIVLNDLDRHIAAFWQCVFHRSDELIARVNGTNATVEEWHAQRAVFLSETADELDVAFATLFLNRTNRSGILDARPIGGLDQAGTWKIDARWRPAESASRISTLARYRNRVILHQADGVEVVHQYIGAKRHLIYADPPYIEKSADLYLNVMAWDDHLRLASALRAQPTRAWLVTYDRDTRVPNDLYPGFQCVDFAIAHTAAAQHVGREFAVFSDGLALDTFTGLGAHSDHKVYEPEVR